MFVLGIDPGLTTTGYGLVRGGHPPTAVAAGVIRTSPDLALGTRLVELHRGLTALIAEHRPQVMAVESIFTNRNLSTAVSVGRASGVAILAAAQAGLPVAEYVPTAVKAAMTGDGAADKAAVAAMVARLLRLAQPPRPADAADALAVALCHLRSAPLTAAVPAGVVR
jgi:crossover junction endodeoxyribonuclease RuvC